jgi:hypothetical protein
MAMNPEVKAEWVKALRSGEYVQGQNTMRQSGNSGSPDTYCCLGVLAELAVKGGAIQAAELIGGSYSYDGSSAWPGEAIYNWAGIVDKPGRDEGIISDLIGHNDEGKNFAYIADEIERGL